jgi:hypothetical protein
VGDPARRAAAFVEARGDELERRRAAVLVGEAARSSALELLAPARSIAEALALLAVADDLRGLHEPVAEESVAWLESAQQDDGSWGDLFATCMLAGYLGKAPSVRPRILDAAGAWIGARWDAERVRGGDWRAIAAFAHFFANVPHALADGALQWCGRELERGLLEGRFDAVRTARVLLWCDSLAIPGARLRAGELRERILREQQADGGWASQGPRVAHTLDALAALTRWRR